MSSVAMAEQNELAAAVRAVQAASELCRRTQHRITSGDTLTKGDASPVTIADFAAQAVVGAALTEALGSFHMVGEEVADDLRGDAAALMRDAVVELVNTQHDRVAAADTVLDWIDAGAFDSRADGTAMPARYWTLDPIDGTKGFLRGDQYAIALALIEHGRVTLGVLGCPNLRNADGTVGAVFAATHEQCVSIDAAGSHPIAVSNPATVAGARFCESVESSHSDHGDAAEIARRLGISAEPFRIDSQCKYAAVARGDASIYLRLPTRADYREKIWDHAAGKFVVEQAGGRVTDVAGADLDFSRGERLENNSGVVATSGRFHDEVIDAVQATLNQPAG